MSACIIGSWRDATCKRAYESSVDRRGEREKGLSADLGENKDTLKEAVSEILVS